MDTQKNSKISRRAFVQAAGAGIAFGLVNGTIAEAQKQSTQKWQPTSERKIRVGIAGYGVCKFGAAFGFQNHPNVIVEAVADLIPARCSALARICNCEKAYASCEEMLGDDKLEAVFIATDARSHARLAIDALNRGYHVASAVPAVFGSLEDAHNLFEAVARSGKKYMMFETTYFRPDCYAWRQQYQAGEFGKLIFTEGEYYHYFPVPLASFNEWRTGLPPQWYPTHSNGYHIGVTGGSFTEVSCMGIPSIADHLKPENNVFKNPFGTEVALFRTSGGGMARMVVSWDSLGPEGETGRLRPQKESKSRIDTRKPPLPPGIVPGGHGGSHGYLMCEFVNAILEDRQPLVDISQALALTASGIVAHQSALKDGELLKIPQFILS